MFFSKANFSLSMVLAFGISACAQEDDKSKRFASNSDEKFVEKKTETVDETAKSTDAEGGEVVSAGDTLAYEVNGLEPVEMGAIEGEPNDSIKQSVSSNKFSSGSVGSGSGWTLSNTDSGYSIAHFAPRTVAYGQALIAEVELQNLTNPSNMVLHLCFDRYGTHMDTTSGKRMEHNQYGTTCKILSSTAGKQSFTINLYPRAQGSLLDIGNQNSQMTIVPKLQMYSISAGKTYLHIWSAKLTLVNTQFNFYTESTLAHWSDKTSGKLCSLSWGTLGGCP